MDIRGALDRYTLRFVAGQPALSPEGEATFSITQRKLEQEKEQEL